VSATRPFPGNPEQNIGAKFGASGGSSFGIKTSYETGYERDAVSQQLTTVSTKEAYELKGGFDFSVGLDLTRSDPPSPDDDAPNQTVLEEATATKFKQSLSAGGSGSTVETYNVSFEFDLKHLRDPLSPNTIAVTYTGPKTWGWKRDLLGLEQNLGGGSSQKINYTITRPEDVDAAIAALANMTAIHNTNIQNQSAFQLLQLVPTVLNEEYSKFRSLLRNMSVGYSIESSTGDGFAIPLGIKGKLRTVWS